MQETLAKLTEEEKNSLKKDLNYYDLNGKENERKKKLAKERDTSTFHQLISLFIMCDIKYSEQQ